MSWHPEFLFLVLDIELLISLEFFLLPRQIFLLLDLIILDLRETILDTIMIYFWTNLFLKSGNCSTCLTHTKYICSAIFKILNSFRNYLLFKQSLLRKAILNRLFLLLTLSKGVNFLIKVPRIVSILLLAWFIVMVCLLVQLFSLFFLFFCEYFLLDILIVFCF